MFRVSDDHQFEEDESMKITLDDDDLINFCEFDQSFDHIYIVKNYCNLEKRSVNDLGAVSMSIELENRIGNSVSKLMALSNDGKFCVIGAAGNTGSGRSNFFYLIALKTQEQFKLTTENLSNTYAPTFINGESEFVAIGGDNGEGVEIWSVEDKEMVHHIDECRVDNSWVTCSYSANGILAAGFRSTDAWKSYLHLYDVKSWEKIYRREFAMNPRSLYMTGDRKYLAIGGTDENKEGGEKCVIVEIK